MTQPKRDHLDLWVEDCLSEPAENRPAEPQEMERIATALQLALTAPKMSTLPQSLRAKLEQQGREFNAKGRKRPPLRAVPQAGHSESSAIGPAIWLPWVLTAASLIFVFWTMTANRTSNETPVAKSAALQRDELLASGSNLLQFDWKATEDPAAAGASGHVVWSDELQQGFMTFRSLEANNPTETQYQLWIFDPDRPDEHPVDGGVFDVPAGQSEVVVPMDPKLGVQKPKLFAVTVEQPGGVVVSKRERIVLLAQEG